MWDPILLKVVLHDWFPRIPGLCCPRCPGARCPPIQTDSNMNQLSIFRLMVAGLFCLAPACTSRDGNTYSREALGRVGGAEKGVVANVRPVKVEGSTRTGTLLGGIAGAALGNELGRGSGDAARILGTAGGAVAGGVVGGGTEKAITGTNAYEYIVKMDSGASKTIVQRDQQPLPQGERVVLLTGPDAKIIPDSGR